MSREVCFCRASQWEIKIQDRPEVIRVEVELAKGVDPESGMTLNLVDADEILQQAQTHLRVNTGWTALELLQQMRLFFEQSAANHRARLIRVEFSIFPSTDASVWLASAPETCLIRKQSRLRVQVKDGKFRTGSLRVLQSHDTAFVFNQEGEMQVPQDSEILPELERLFPQAFKICFQDVVTGEFWSSEP